MPFVPLPFVVAILLFVLFVAVFRRQDGATANQPLVVLILVSAVQSVFSGLRWGYGIEDVMYVAPIGAATVPPLAYAGVKALVRRSTTPLFWRLSLHALPAVIIVFLLATSLRGAIDAVLIATFIAYAAAILALMRPGADALRLAPFEGTAPAYRAILFAAFALLFSATIDLFVALDLAFTQGDHVRPVIAVGNLVMLGILSIAAAAASRSRAPVETVESAPDCGMPEDTATLLAVQTLMQEKKAYRDVDLNLDRLSRKLGIPARQISVAINRAMGKNVSQYVNEFRIAEACELLVRTDRPVTEIMFEVGFQTKSNFNREFRRVSDTTPLEWRERNAKPSSIAI